METLIDDERGNGELMSIGLNPNPEPEDREMTVLDEKLLSAKTYVGNGRVNFEHPLETFAPFISIIEKSFGSLDDIHIEVRTDRPVVNRNEEDDSENRAFGRVLVEARRPITREVFGESFEQVFGLITAFDTAMPNIIAYGGCNARACINLHVWNASCYQQFNYLGAGSKPYAFVEAIVDRANDDEDRFLDFIEKCMSTYIDHKRLRYLFGELFVDIATGKNDIGSSNLRYAAELMFRPNGRYFVDEHANASVYTVMQALTQYVTDKAVTGTAPLKSKVIVDWIRTLLPNGEIEA